MPGPEGGEKLVSVPPVGTASPISFIRSMFTRSSIAKPRGLGASVSDSSEAQILQGIGSVT
jgi:hypothetical protein